jgi:gliding motility-associated-like protein
MTKYIYILTLILVGLAPLSTFGQLTTTGDAIALPQCGKYQLTNSNGGQTGGVYNATPIDVTSDFSLKFCVNFGDNDFGGDGMAFSLQDPSGGWDASGLDKWGLGIGGTPNEIHVEFDTRYSHIECACGNNDNGVDHLGLFQNGGITHGGPDDLYTGVPMWSLIGGQSNVEDGENRNVEIRYTAATQLFEVFINEEATPSLQETLVNPLSFYVNGNTALWGWTGSTPTASSISNVQTVGVANSSTIDYSLVNCQNTVMDFTAQTFSFNTIVNTEWYFDGFGPVNGQTVQHTFTTPGTHIVVVQTEDNTGCVGSDTLEIGVGFEIQTSVSSDTVCPGETVDLEAEAVFYVPPTCNYVLMMGDLFCDGWAGSEIEVYADGVLFGTYTPPNVGCGGAGWEEYTDLILPDGAVIDVNFIYAGVFGAEIYYQVFEPGNPSPIIDVLAGTVTGNISDSFTVDCGVSVTTYSYLWNDITTPTAGPATTNWTGASVPHPFIDFEVMVENDQTGCIVGDTIRVMTYDTVYADVSGDATICDGETTDITFTLSGTPPFDLTYSVPGGPNVTETGITTTTHVVTVSDAGVYAPVSIVGNGCPGNISANTATVTVIPLPNVSISGNATYCAGDNMNNITVTSANGGSVFYWDDNSPLVGDTTNAIGAGSTFDPNTMGYTSTITIYAQEFSIPNGCAGAVVQETLTILSIPVAPNVIGTTEYCDGDALTAMSVSPAPSGTIIWSDGAGNALGNGTSYIPTFSGAGTYALCAKEDNGTCTGDSTCISIVIKPTPLAPGISGDDTYCLADPVTDLTATPGMGGVITWSDGSTGNTFTPTLNVGATTYCANETLNGCTGPDSCFIVTVYVDPTINIPATASICIGDSVLVCAENNGIFPPDIITWDHGPDTECVYMGPPANEQYTVCLTNPACGTACDTINIIVNPLPVIMAGDDQTTGLGGEVTMWATGGLSYVWSPSVTCIGSACANVYAVPAATTVYVVEGTDENGCVNTDSVTITLNGELSVFVANIFSPNNDGRNDEILVQGPRLTNFEWKIFDRWGRIMFETTDQKQAWDGKFNGEPVPQQVVVYKLSGTDVLGRPVSRAGNIMIAR